MQRKAHSRHKSNAEYSKVDGRMINIINGKLLQYNDDQLSHLIQQNDQSINDAYLYIQPLTQLICFLSAKRPT